MVNTYLKIKSKAKRFLQDAGNQESIEIAALITFIFIILTYKFEMSLKLILLAISIYFVYHEMLGDILLIAKARAGK